MTSYMLGIDIGTTSTKAVLFSEKGDVIQKESIGYPLHTPDISTAEQNPDEIFQAVIQSTAKIMRLTSRQTAVIHFIQQCDAQRDCDGRKRQAAHLLHHLGR